MKKILIIGATSAIAEQCARIWAARGNEIYLVARNKERIRTIAADLKVRGATQIYTYCTDLNNIDSHDDFFDIAEDKMSRIDIVLIAHGTLPNQKSCERNIKETLGEIQTNAISTISLLTLISNRFERKKDGTICVITSVAGDRGRASNYIYGSAKAMVSSFISGLQQRLNKSSVKIINIKPGFVDTPMTKAFKKGLIWVKPNKVAEKIVKAIDAGCSEIYIPAIWRVIMALIKVIPNKFFFKLKL